MTTLRAVEGDRSDPDESVRLVARMLLGMYRMTEIELGRRLGLPRTSIYNRMQGKTPFSVAEVVAMAELFDAPPAVFLAGPTALIRTAGGSITTQKPTQTGAIRPEVRKPNSVPAMPSLYLVA